MNFQKPKHHGFYWAIAHEAAAQSVATRHKVGAVVVTLSGMISTGWNGTPAGMDNCCEKGEVIRVYNEDGIYQGERRKTSPETIHAERNAIDKMTREGVSTKGSVLFVSRAPCFECAKALHGLGLKAIYYEENHDDMRGVKLLRDTGTTVLRRTYGTKPLSPTYPPTKVQQLNQYYGRGAV